MTMKRKRALIVFISICILSLSESALGGDERWITYSSERSVTHEYDAQSIDQVSEAVRNVDIRVNAKPGSKAFKEVASVVSRECLALFSMPKYWLNSAESHPDAQITQKHTIIRL
jgi:hypothetical protein